MVVKDNSICFNFHKNIAIKEMREKKERKDQIKTQDVMEFGLKCLRFRDSQPLIIEVEPNTKK
jgi:hypothetical protein